MPKQLKLHMLEEKFCISKLPQFAELPHIFTRGELCFVARTEDELSIISPEFMAPTNVQQETGWRCFRIDGTVSMKESGMIAAVTQPLAEANIGTFVISTFNTDYFFIMEENLIKATQALQHAGHEFVHKE